MLLEVLEWTITKDLTVLRQGFLKFLTDPSPEIRKEASSNATCGYVFPSEDLIYTCHDCAVDDTCVLCQNCFNPEDHKGHRIRYYRSIDRASVIVVTRNLGKIL